MKIQTADYLNRLNQNFYRQVGKDFNQTRQGYWRGFEEGWNRMKITKKHLKVLDLGCGNARYGKFVREKFRGQMDYVGIDSDQGLLEKAGEYNWDKMTKVELIEDDLLAGKWLKDSFVGKFDVVALLGIMHHVPPGGHQVSLLEQAGKCLAQSGVMIVSVWQLVKMHQHTGKLIGLEEAIGQGLVSVEKDEVDGNDYLLGWGTKENVYRYCRQVSQTEMKKLLKPAGLVLKDEFGADGRDGRSNTYYLLSKRALSATQP